MVRLLDAPLDFLELGSGSAVKTRLLIGEALRVQDELRYSPIDISTDAICSSSLALVESFPGLHVRAYAGDYFDVLESQPVLSDHKMLAMLMDRTSGTTSRMKRGCFRCSAPRCARVMVSWSAPIAERSRDARNGIRRSHRCDFGFQPQRARGDQSRARQGFDLRKFRHVVRYDEQRGSVDSFLEAQERMAVRIRGANLAFRDAGEQIIGIVVQVCRRRCGAAG